MAKKKKHASQPEGQEEKTAQQPGPVACPLKPSSSGAATQPVLFICRNKHWRYISSFHGPWLQLPPEILETLANANYNTPRPRPIDPGVLFDLVKIRKLVDDATNLAVRAASGVASSSLSSSMHPASALGLGFGGGNQAKLSRERKHRLREQATQKLSKAYHLDEIASSVATMQGASSLEDVASLVLQRNAEDPDAKYVHFFHEKIPSRQLADSTSLTSLDDIIRDKPAQGQPLRTRATVRVFKNDLEGAVADLNLALQMHRSHRSMHAAPESPQAQSAVYEVAQYGRRQEDLVLKEDEQPSSLETQLLFQRAGAYLGLACRHIDASLVHENAGTGDADDGATETETSRAQKEAQRKTYEAQRAVKQNAKRALRDYMAFLSHMEYSPDLPMDIAEEFTRKVNQANHIRMPRSYSQSSRSESPVSTSCQHRVYVLSDLFNATPVVGLPPFPPSASRRFEDAGAMTTETATYHPLVTDALHSLLLCHCLMQTSTKELLRHAYMVARLARLGDGYPVFQASRSPARMDWLEVLRRSNNWINLSHNWEVLCAPAPIPVSQPSDAVAITSAASAVERARQHEYAASLGDNPTPLSMAMRARQARAERDYELERAVAALDYHLNRPETHEEGLGARNAGLPAKPIRALIGNGSATEDLESNQGPASADVSPEMASQDPATDANTTASPTAMVNSQPTTTTVATTTARKNPGDGPGSPLSASSGARRWVSSGDDGRDYVITTERAAAVARWVCEAPPNAGSAAVGPDGVATARKRKKKTAVKKAAGGGGGDGEDRGELVDAAETAGI